jgi:hypothetical protein
MKKIKIKHQTQVVVFGAYGVLRLQMHPQPFAAN